MTKMKKFLALLASLTAVATLGLATACGDKGDSSTPVDSTPPASTPGDSTPDDSTPVEKQYTVTVKKPDGTPAAGLWLQACVGDQCKGPWATDENGIVTFPFEEDATVYHVTSNNGTDYADYEAVDFNTVPGTLAYEVTLVEKAPVVDEITISEPLSGTGAWGDGYQIEANKYYMASADAQTTADGAVCFSITSTVDGTYTINVPEAANEQTVEINITGSNDMIADGYSFPVKANTQIDIWVVSSTSTYDPESYCDVYTYHDAVFGVSFDTNYEADGSTFAPIELVSGTSYSVEEQCNYIFTAPSAGQYKLTLDDWAAASENLTFFDVAYNKYDRGCPIDIAEGETIKLLATQYSGNALSWTFSFGASLENDANYDMPPALGSEENPLTITEAGSYDIVVESGAAYFLDLNFCGQFVLPEGLTAGAWINFQLITFDAGDTIAFADYHPMMNAFLSVSIYNEGENAVSATVVVSDYVAGGEGEELANGTLDVTTTNSYGYNETPDSFTAPVAGKYTFTVPSGLGLYSKASYDAYGAPEIDFYDNEAGFDVVVTLAENEVYEFYVGSMLETDWFINWTAVVADVDDGDEGGSDVELVTDQLFVGTNNIAITQEIIDEGGINLIFVAEADGTYSFTSSYLILRVNGNGIMNGMGELTLTAGTYTVAVVTTLVPSPATYQAEITYTVPSTPDEAEAGSEDAPIAIDDIFAAPIVTATGIYEADFVWYTFTLTNDATLVLTFDNADTWIRVKADMTVLDPVSGSSYDQQSYEFELVAGTYKLAIASWTNPNEALSLTVTEKAV